MKLNDLRPAEGSTQKRKRVGRGTGSGKGKTVAVAKKARIPAMAGRCAPTSRAANFL